MSLEEFLGDESLGDSVWDESDINLDAISNTTNIDLFRQARNNKSNDARGHNPSHNNYHRDPYAFNEMNDINNNNNDNNNMMPGPPYIVKFSNLPPRFSNRDIEELFQAKYTKFIKFKLFWELNINPSIETMKNGSEFEQNFKHDSKVAFVELYTARDLQKIVSFWKEPLRDIYNINTEIAIFENFKEYISKTDLLKNDPQIDASRPYVEHKRKPNPFGSAKPADTQSVTLEIEKKMDELHIEDTTTLRRLSQNEGDSAPLASLVRQQNAFHNNETLDTSTSAEKPKITILKKPTLSYSEVLQKSVEETKRNRSTSPAQAYNHSTESSPVTNTNLINTAIDDDETQITTGDNSNTINNNDNNNSNNDNNDNDGENDDVDDGDVSTKTESDNNENGMETSDSSQFKFKNNDREGSNSSYKNRRGGYNNRDRNNNRGGYHNNRGGYNNERGGRGGYKSYSSCNNNYNKGSRYSRDKKDDESSYERKERTEKTETQSYSLFKPASSFLQNENSSNNNGKSFNNDHHGYNNNNRGNDRGRGRGRGGRGDRGRGRGGFNRGGQSNFRNQSDA
ncbi:similar to Saccharomyces cerevisiae YML017W PSP2 Asn rich cytoplasmic protein that contains RGG motifs [Maudiozyma saulgeensis]|uniref:Similar to Saccharomyces cerevisiae YML017W PSP2 Asn rich cytoplasmic protein that contains RGG motifs n=1 Tax=Maudiozyma saulgeensis TaxID=1789683 RepID=A0A1X7QWK1_9SACH|nr:similar to Saccharomyces cerevisiae YML017W PSP2 Asn rich cytoplasmic protein that contains RGG motifs [Kazachstania saulgeensis]